MSVKKVPEIKELTVDAELTGQKYACLSFVISKEGVCFKSRGVFATEAEAKAQKEKLEKADATMSVQILEVGKWEQFDAETKAPSKSGLQLKQHSNYVLKYDRTLSQKTIHEKKMSQLKASMAKVRTLPTPKTKKVPVEVKLTTDESIPKQNFVIMSMITPQESRVSSLINIKVRGVFETEEEAKKYAAELTTKDSKYDAIVGKVGEWQTWTNWITDEPVEAKVYSSGVQKIMKTTIPREKVLEARKLEAKKTEVKRLESKNLETKSV
jgi:hypothetical protein